MIGRSERERARGLLRTAAVLGASSVFALIAAPSALAKTYFPNRHGDHTPNGCSLKPHKDCTLREAVISANHHPGKDAIVLRAGKTYKLSLISGGGDLDVTDPSHGKLTIRSSGRQRATIDAEHVDRVIEQTTPLLLVSVKLTGGDTSGTGGGIHAGPSKLEIVRTLVSGNHAADGGGGIEGGSGVIEIRKSRLHANRSDHYGGGIENGDSALRILRSTFDKNVAVGGDYGGGGLDNYNDGTARIVNSTFANNRTDGPGGGIFEESGSSDNLNMNATTIVRNLADVDNDNSGVGGGIAQTSTKFYMENSLIALNSANGTPGRDCFTTSPLHSLGHNLIYREGAACGGLVDSDFVDGEVPSGSLHLGLLAHNGGPTPTVALGKHSRARNRANGDAPAKDQRGVARHNPDIGAFEY